MPWQDLQYGGYSPNTPWDPDIDDAAVSHMAPFLGPSSASMTVWDDIGTVIGSSTTNTSKHFKSVSLMESWSTRPYGGHPFMKYRDSIWWHVRASIVFDRGIYQSDKNDPFKVSWSQPPMRGRGRMSLLRRGIR